LYNTPALVASVWFPGFGTGKQAREREKIVPKNLVLFGKKYNTV
jgi:hypothetical protein